jgi:hypothetical protein
MIFESAEKLYDHLEVHADTIDNQEKKKQRR